MSADVSRRSTSPVGVLSRYRPEVDGLRAFAVIAVIINHFNQAALPGGYLGVDIFFVISGYVITSSLSGRPSEDFKDFISGFYERRVKRLVPALSLFVLIMSIAIALVNPKPGLSITTGLASLFGLSNLFLLSQATDYFAQSTELNIFTHTWSLGVEEQFYALFPFLIWFSGFGRQKRHGARNLFCAVGVLSIVSLIGFIHFYSVNQSAAYFLMPTRFWEMAAGCLIFIGFQQRRSIENILAKIPPFLILVLIVGVMYLPMSVAVESTVAVVALSAVLIASLKPKTAAFKAFTHPVIVYIGLISYSLYLWHWGVLSISRWTVGIHWWSVPFQVALMTALALGSYRWVEVPLRKGSWFGARWKTLVAGGGILLVLSGGIIAFGKLFKGALFISRYSSQDFEYVQAGMECELAGRNPTASPLDCIKTSPGSSNIYVFGDSHASNLVPALQSAAVATGYDDVKYLTNATAQRMAGGPWHRNNSVRRTMEQVSKDDLIVWSSSQSARTAGIVDQLNYLLDLSLRTGVPLLLVDDIVSYGGDHKFFPRFAFYGRGPSRTLEAVVRGRKSFTQLLLDHVGDRENVYYYDPLSLLCRQGVCSAVSDGQLMYADGSPHFTGAGAALLSDSMTRKVKEIRVHRSLD